MVSAQWFVRTANMADRALKSVTSKELTLIPERYGKIWGQWLDPTKIKDWCISRQLWWGHRIPVYFIPESDYTKYVIARNGEEALALAKEQFPNDIATIESQGLEQETDVLDTWFRYVGL